jgi:iron complex transport system ATP-binding protein
MLSVTMGGTGIVTALDLTFAQAQWHAIVGPNGAGKSTTLRAMAGLQAASGTVNWFGQSFAHIPAPARARKVAWLGQSEAPDLDLPVHEVVALGRLPHQRGLFAVDPAQAQVCREVMTLTEVLPFEHRRLSTLSGGERQKVLLARALAVKAQVLLLDEPLLNLDVHQQVRWLSWIRHSIAQGVTVISVLHELDFALQADTITIIDRGRCAYQGACDDLEAHHALTRTFDNAISIQNIAHQWRVLAANGGRTTTRTQGQGNAQ